MKWSLLALIFGFCIDLLLGDPQWFPHPVVLIGRLISSLERLGGGWLLGLDVKNGWKIFRRDRFNHASPNSAQTESVCAGLLGVRLAGDAWYHGVLHKKKHIGDPLRPICHGDIPTACRLLYVTAFVTLALCCAGKLLAGMVF